MTKSLYIGVEGVGIWEKPASGDPMDVFRNPADHLDDIYFSTDFNYYVSATTDGMASVDIEHPFQAASTGFDPYGNGVVTNFQEPVEYDYLLLTHNAGVELPFMLTVDGVQLPGGLPIQVNGATRGERTICAYSTTTEIRLYEQIVAQAADLPAVTKTYKVVAFRPFGDQPGSPIVDIFKTSAGRLRLGHDRIDTDYPSLREAITGEAGQFFVSGGPTLDGDNGEVRAVTGDGTIYQTGDPTGKYAYGGNFVGAGSVKAVLA